MPKKYNNYLEVNPSFESVVDIDAEQRNRNLWREYIVGDDMETLMDYLCQSLGNEAPDARRSFWIHGSYGTGKSYASIFVKHMIEEKPEVVEAYLAGSQRLSKFKNRFSKCRRNGDYLLVWKTGCTGIRTGDMMLLEAEKAIQDALVSKYGDNAYLGQGSLVEAVTTKLDDRSINWDYLLETTMLGDDFGSVEELREQVESGNLSALQSAASVIRSKGYGLFNNLQTFESWISDVIDGNGLSKSGIFFIWDEFTEYVAHSDDHTIIQQLSEFTKVKPFFMFYVVHRSEEMVDSMGKDRYQLITNRFHSAEFHISADAAYDLIAGSINVRNGMASNWSDARRPVIKTIKPFLPDISGLDDRIGEMIEPLCPMHPMTIKLLSRVAESFAAAQRTMFRFMKDQSNDSIGFIGYINQYGPEDQACWLTPEWLWDYFFTRESDFSDKDTKAAEYIRHYEENRHMVANDENALRVFKISMLLLAVMSSTRGVYGGTRTQGGIAATVECLENCLAGVVSRKQVNDLLSTMEDCKILLRDEAANGVVRLQLPFRDGAGDSFDKRFAENDKKYTRYQMFTKDGIFSNAFEEKAWDENDATAKRMKICACCAETNSIKTRLDEIKKELEKYDYKLGLLIVIAQSDSQVMSVQTELARIAKDASEPRLTIALVKKPLTDADRKKWLTTLTKQELAQENGQTAAANQFKMEASTVISSWIGDAVNGSKMVAWNGTQEFNNLFGMPNLRKTIRINVQDELFPYAPEMICMTNTAYKSCNDGAPLAGITRESGNAQLRNVLNALQRADLLSISTIDKMVGASGSKEADAISALARTIRDRMDSGQRVVLSELWDDLQKPPFGYYNTIVCGVLLGYVLSCYKDSAFSWTDNSQSTHVLGESTLKTMVLNMCKGGMTTDYLSAGSITFQKFRDYAKSIMHLTDAQVASETECVHNMREAITKSGAPFWALKYLPVIAFGSEDLAEAAGKIVDNVQLVITQDLDREASMSEVVQLFTGRGKVKRVLTQSFSDKSVLSNAFRTFLFQSSPELQQIAQQINIKPEELSDKLHMSMQNAIYTWTEEQVKEKLPDIVSEYQCLDSLNDAMGKVYHSVEEAQKELNNLFKFLRIPLAVIEKTNLPWASALKVMYQVSRNGLLHSTHEDREAYSVMLKEHGRQAMDCLSDAKPALAEVLETQEIELNEDELNKVYSGLKDLTCDASQSQFDKEFKNQINQIGYARNRQLLVETWRMVTGEETVKSWCETHTAPIQWIAGKDLRQAITTLTEVLQDHRTLDDHVQRAIHTLRNTTRDLLTDNDTISKAFFDAVGEEYRTLFAEQKTYVIAQAKMKLGNDMSAWDISELPECQKILKRIQQQKAKEEKFNRAVENVHHIQEHNLRKRIVDFLEKHPEFCDDFID